MEHDVNLGKSTVMGLIHKGRVPVPLYATLPTYCYTRGTHIQNEEPRFAVS